MTDRSELTLGPVLFYWPAEQKRDFYFRIADEAPVDTVYLGEVVCSKREPFFAAYIEEVAERLTRAGKTVVLSGLAEIMMPRERELTETLCSRKDYPVEANDAAALYHLRGKPHRVGPFVNVYNEDTLAFLALNGAEHVTAPTEMPGAALAELARKAAALDVDLEVMVYGRIPLALSARCYHARAHDRVKDNCRYACEADPDGMDLTTMAGEPFLAVNGIQTLSHTCLNLMREMAEMEAMGIRAFRLSPHSHDMVETSRLFRAVLDRVLTPDEAADSLAVLGLPVPFANGFYHGAPGVQWVEQKAA